MPANFGRFKGDVIALWLPDGRNMQLTQKFAYIDPRNKEWVAAKGSVVNGASIPGSLWSVIGGPFEGQYRHASVIHDVACMEMTSEWDDTHLMFYEACRCGGVSEGRAKMMYYAVYHFGPRWQTPSIGPQKAVRVFGAGPAADGELISATQPVAVEPHDLRVVMEYISEENPTLAELRQLLPEVAQASTQARAARRGVPKKKPKKKRKG